MICFFLSSVLLLLSISINLSFNHPFSLSFSHLPSHNLYHLPSHKLTCDFLGVPKVGSLIGRRIDSADEMMNDDGRCEIGWWDDGRWDEMIVMMVDQFIHLFHIIIYCYSFYLIFHHLIMISSCHLSSLTSVWWHDHRIQSTIYHEMRWDEMVRWDGEMMRDEMVNYERRWWGWERKIIIISQFTISFISPSHHLSTVPTSSAVNSANSWNPIW